MELADPQGPFGARGVAEMPLVPFLPAVASAIHDAVGVWMTEQPFTPERVLAALSSSPSVTVRSQPRVRDVKSPSPSALSQG
ncbi:MAG: hypothetical protein ACRDJC_23640, partial [Thermomicrobiales bacterium]